MFTLHAVQAQFGDCLILEFGTAAKPRYILIDGGPPGNFDADADNAIKKIVGAGGKLELVVLSHIDNDHVVGLLDLFAALEEDDANNRSRRVSVGGLWHNAFGKIIDPDGEITQRLQNLMAMAGAANVAMPLATDAFLGVKEGNRLRILAKKLDIKTNKNFQKDLIQIETAKKSIKIGTLTLRVVGPNQTNLDELRKDWLKWLKKMEDKMASNPSQAAMDDDSVPNLSSIVLLAEANGKTALLTGDARGDHIIDGLKTAKLLKNDRLHVNLLKVQHHGSDRNATRKFFDTITADTYVISANGKYGNPDLPTLKWIVEAAHDVGRKIEIVLTNETPAVKKIRQSHNPAAFGYKLTIKPKTKHSIAVALAA